MATNNTLKRNPDDPLTALESQMAERIVTLETALREFHIAVDDMCGVLGMYGEISARDDRVSAVMDHLFAIDELLKTTEKTR